MNGALYRATVSDRPPVNDFGTYMYDRGQAWVDQTHGNRYHLGKDTPVAQGTPVYASGTGLVVRVSKTPTIGYIWIVDIAYPMDGGGEVRVQTHHMSRIDVEVGNWVSLTTLTGLSGGKPGTMGAGNSQGPHVHTQTYFNGLLVDPDSVLNSRSQIAGGGVTPIPEEDFLSALTENEQREVYNALVRDSPNGRYFMTDALGNRIGAIAAGGILYPGQQYNAFTALANAAYEAAAKASQATIAALKASGIDTDDIDEDAIVAGVLEGLQPQFDIVNANIDDQPTTFEVVPKATPN